MGFGSVKLLLCHREPNQHRIRAHRDYQQPGFLAVAPQVSTLWLGHLGLDLSVGIADPRTAIMKSDSLH